MFRWYWKNIFDNLHFDEDNYIIIMFFVFLQKANIYIFFTHSVFAYYYFNMTLKEEHTKHKVQFIHGNSYQAVLNLNSLEIQFCKETKYERLIFNGRKHLFAVADADFPRAKLFPSVNEVQ